MTEWINNRISLEKREGEWLAPYAVKSNESRGRIHPEKEHDFRTAFQRDRDRIIHSTAFRRLEYKTQVFVNHEGDHYRTRLTHTLETAQIARSIGRILRLNEDLIECIALAHDLGHGPFGHAGQEALAEMMEQYGGFEHNRQCLRIVDELEESYTGFKGLNLTFEVREGLRKHEEKRFHFLEADIVDLADEIAYCCHDLDDGMRAGFLEESKINKVKLWQEINRYIETKSGRAPKSIKQRMAIRLLINRLVNDLVAQTLKNIKVHNIKTSGKVGKVKTQIVAFSKSMKKKLDEVKNFLTRELYHHYRVVRMTEKGKRFIKALFCAYTETPKQLPPHILKKSEKYGLERVVCDYIAGMTDRYALDEYSKLFQPYEER
jgi:dGTPase